MEFIIIIILIQLPAVSCRLSSHGSFCFKRQHDNLRNDFQNAIFMLISCEIFFLLLQLVIAFGGQLVSVLNNVYPRDPSDSRENATC